MPPGTTGCQPPGCWRPVPVLKSSLPFLLACAPPLSPGQHFQGHEDTDKPRQLGAIAGEWRCGGRWQEERGTCSFTGPQLIGMPQRAGQRDRECGDPGSHLELSHLESRCAQSRVLTAELRFGVREEGVRTRGPFTDEQHVASYGESGMPPSQAADGRSEYNKTVLMRPGYAVSFSYVTAFTCHGQPQGGRCYY